MPRDWHISQALTSVRKLEEIISELSDDEIVKAIELEEASTRRPSILTRLRRQLRANARVRSEANLKEKLHGS